ncbi:MAG: TfoX/Sxy family protein [Armatimonadetes bacterium]|nr:TfoX/Sxy family protein [Armatimonadota bacterium]
MAIDPDFRAMMEEKLSRAVPIRTRSMFGGVGIYSRDLFFAIMDDKNIWLKTSDLNRADFEALGLKPFEPWEDGRATMPYYPLPEGLIDEPDELRVWVEKALAVAEAAKKPRAAKTRRK